MECDGGDCRIDVLLFCDVWRNGMIYVYVYICMVNGENIKESDEGEKCSFIQNNFNDTGKNI